MELVFIAATVSKGLQFLHARGLITETLREFQLAYQDEIGKVHSSTFPTELEHQLSSRFNNCILFPSHNIYGKPQSVIARRLVGKPKFDYLPGFKAHNYLFGLYKAIPYILQKDYVVITEGPFDAIMCHQYNIRNTVAALGTYLTVMQATMLLRFTNKWLVVFDNDSNEAGQKAAKSLIGVGKQYGATVKILSLPTVAGGSDPDDFLVREGLQGWNKLCAMQLKNTFADPKIPTTTGIFSIQAKQL